MKSIVFTINVTYEGILWCIFLYLLIIAIVNVVYALWHRNNLGSDRIYDAEDKFLAFTIIQSLLIVLIVFTLSVVVEF